MKFLIMVTALFAMVVAPVAGASDKLNSRHQIQRAREYLYHPGFRAVIASIVEKSFIYVESTDHGLVFRVCSLPEAGEGGGKGGAKEAQNNSDPNVADAASGTIDPSQCPTLLNNEDIGIPPEMLLDQSLGLGRILLTSLRVVMDGAVIFALDVGTSFSFAKTVPFSIAAVSAKSISNVHPDNPILSLSELAHAQTVTKKILKYGDESDRLRDGQAVTVLLTQHFPAILTGMTMELLSIANKIIKKDGPGSLGLKWECDYHRRMNNLLNKEQPQADAVADDPQDECANVQ